MSRFLPILVFLVIHILISPGVEANSLRLFSTDEESHMRLSISDWAKELHLIRKDKEKDLITRDMLDTPSSRPIGPSVVVVNPESSGDFYRSKIPLRLLVYLKGRKAPVDIGTLKIKGKRGLFSLDITDKLLAFLRKPTAGEEADYVIDAQIPQLGAGRYMIVMTVADKEGNRKEKKALLEVVKQ